MAKFKNVSDSMARLYEQAKSELLLGTSDDISDYLSMTIDTFNSIFPMFTNEADDTKRAVIAKTQKDIAAVLMMSTATQACWAGQYRNGEKLDFFDEAGVLSYYTAMQAAGVIGGDE